MSLAFRKPTPVTAKFVRRHIVSEKTQHGPETYRPWATGSLWLVHFFNELENYRIIIDGIEKPIASRAFMAGQLEFHDVEIQLDRATAAVVTELAPQAFYTLCKAPALDLTGDIGLLETISERTAVAAARAFSSPCSCADDAVSQSEAFLQMLAADAQEEDRSTDVVLSIIAQTPETFQISQAAETIGMSRQRLAKRFTEVVGLSPKFYSRVVQINQVAELMLAGEHAKLAEIAQQAGFYDQSHLYKGMMQFFSEGPNAFLRGKHKSFLGFLKEAQTVEQQG